MADLPTWEIWVIVAGGTVIGSALVFVLCIVLALLLRWMTGVREPPAMVLFAAREFVRYFRRRRRALRPKPGPVHPKPANIATPAGSGLGPSHRLTVEDAPIETDIEVLSHALEAYNESRWPQHPPWKPVAIFVREGAQIVAGLAGNLLRLAIRGVPLGIRGIAQQRGGTGIDG